MPLIHLRTDQPFSLDLTLNCGQVFRWDRNPDGWWYGVVGNHVIKICQDGSTVRFEGVPEHFIEHYFSLETDLNSITQSFDCDPHIHAAIAQCHGLRLIRQPAWECLVSYICATNSNIPMIRRRIANIAQRFGHVLDFESRQFFSFPDPSSLANTCSESLTECKLGYRTPYVLETACEISDEKQWQKYINSLPYEKARHELMKLQGVGPKAADCILLFAFQKYESFPVDVWIRRIINEHYIQNQSPNSMLTGWEYDMIRRFARQHFGQYCGYAQEYLYAARQK